MRTLVLAGHRIPGRSTCRRCRLNVTFNCHFIGGFRVRRHRLRLIVHPGTVGHQYSPNRTGIFIVELKQLIHDWHVFRVDLLVGLVHPQHRRAHQMSQPMQFARDEMLVAKPCAKDVVWSIYNSASQMRIACDQLLHTFNKDTIQKKTYTNQLR